MTSLTPAAINDSWDDSLRAEVRGRVGFVVKIVATC